MEPIVNINDGGAEDPNKKIAYEIMLAKAAVKFYRKSGYFDEEVEGVEKAAQDAIFKVIDVLLDGVNKIHNMPSGAGEGEHIE